MNEELSCLLHAARALIQTDRQLGCSLGALPSTALAQPAAPPAASTATRTLHQGPANADQPAQADPAEALDGSAKGTALRAIREQEVAPCRRCQLASQRNKVVFGEGDPDARLVFVGEGPGQEEDLTGRPFVGRAGELLGKMIAAMGLSREQVYIANMVKCRPPGNRTPAPEEVQACWNYLLRQLEIIRPAVIVTLGNPATQGLLQTAVGITKLRGQWQKLPALSPSLEGIDVMPTFHPAYLLRNYSVDCREKVWSDLQQVMKKLGLAVPARK